MTILFEVLKSSTLSILTSSEGGYIIRSSNDFTNTQLRSMKVNPLRLLIFLTK